MKKTITLLALAFCLNGKAQSSDYWFIVYNTIDDFFSNNKKSLGRFHSDNRNTLVLEDTVTWKKYKIKKWRENMPYFAVQYFGQKEIQCSPGKWETFFGGNKKYFATWNSGGLSSTYEKVDDAFFLKSGIIQGGGNFLIYYYRASDTKKTLTLEELVQDCPEVYNQYMASKKEKGHKNDKNYIEYIYDQIKFFKMYIACKK